MSRIEVISALSRSNLSIKDKVKSVLPSGVLSVIQEVRYGRTDFPYSTQVKLGGVSADFLIEHSTAKHRLEQFGGEHNYIREFLEVMDRESVVLDIGASLGLHTVLASKKADRIIAVEPDQDIMESLDNNVKANGVDNVVFIQKAAGSNSGREVLFTEGVEGRSPSIVKNVNHHASKIEVEVVRIDNLIKQLIKNGIISREPDVLKIDVEGFEGEVLKGMSGLLGEGSAPKHIFIELHPKFLPQFGVTAREILNNIAEMGYRKVSRRKRSNELLFHFSRKR